jgi:hypothetical protein
MSTRDCYPVHKVNTTDANTLGSALFIRFIDDVLIAIWNGYLSEGSLKSTVTAKHREAVKMKNQNLIEIIQSIPDTVELINSPKLLDILIGLAQVDITSEALIRKLRSIKKYQIPQIYENAINMNKTFKFNHKSEGWSKCRSELSGRFVGEQPFALEY